MKNLLYPIIVFSTISFVVVFSIITFVIYAIFHPYDNSKKIETICFSESSNNPNLIFIPVTINDSVYQFVFDTGASHNVIDSGLARKMGLSADTTVFMSISRFTENRSDSIAFAIKEISIRNLKTTGLFALNGYKGLFHDNIEEMQSVGAIMGVEIIKQFNWLFNFVDNTVTLSKSKIKVPAMPEDQILTLDFYFDSTTTVDLTIDGIAIKNVTFDTGHHGAVHLWNKSKSLDIVFSKTDYETLTSNSKQLTVSIPYDFGKAEAFVIDSMQINDFTMQGMFVSKQNDYKETYITANFIRRFRMMYIDRTNNKIHLYASPSDSLRNHRRDLQIFRRSALEFGEEHTREALNRGDTISSRRTPATDSILELWNYGE